MAARMRADRKSKSRKEIRTENSIGADSTDKPLLDVITSYLAGKADITVTDLGEPGFNVDVSQEVIDGEYHRAPLICGTGIGVSIFANKTPGDQGGADTRYLFGRKPQGNRSPR